ncbi:thioredoxin family [Nannochloropsis oceanica]
MKTMPRLSSSLLFFILLSPIAAFLPPSPGPLASSRPSLPVFSSSSASASPEGDSRHQQHQHQHQQHNRVELRVYDIGGKYTPMMSALLRKEMPAIWHVGVGVYGKEYWFSTRIESKDLGDTETAFGMVPHATYDLGHTLVEREAFEAYLEEELDARFNIDTYKVFTHNCNHFSRDALAFLMGGNVEMPSYILENSDKALDALPQGQAMLTKTIANQVARVVMLAWGNANRSKEEIARREARRKTKKIEVDEAQANGPGKEGGQQMA